MGGGGIPSWRTGVQYSQPPQFRSARWRCFQLAVWFDQPDRCHADQHLRSFPRSQRVPPSAPDPSSTAFLTMYPAPTDAARLPPRAAFLITTTHYRQAPRRSAMPKPSGSVFLGGKTSRVCRVAYVPAVTIHIRKASMGRSLATFCCLVVAASLLHAQDSFFFNAKISTAHPQHPYAESVAMRGDKNFAIGNLYEVTKALP